MSSDAKIEANRANSKLSTGPKTDRGKAKSSLNAVRTGLTGRTVLLPGDDLDAYNLHTERCFKIHAPASEHEEALVQSIAETEWRLGRIPSLETGIYAIGRLELADKFADQDPAVRAALIEAQIFLTYQKQLSNLSVQEHRLRRQREKDLAALKKLQDERAQVRATRLNEAAKLCRKAQKERKPFDPQKLGFEFSMAEIEGEIDKMPLFDGF